MALGFSPSALVRAWPRGKRRQVLVAVAALAAVAGGSFYVYMKLIEKGYLRYNKWDRRVRGTLRVGDPAPDFELARYEGGRVRLSELWAEKPVVLVFGSCT
jgi:hypothetical protein